MRATYMYGAGDVRVIDVPDPTIQRPTDALVRVVRACVCGSDLHPYHSMPTSTEGSPMGHEFIGVVEEVGSEVSTLSTGDFVIAPFAVSCGYCEFCRAGLHTSCANGGFWNDPGLGTAGGQAEAVRVPLADGTLVKVPGVDAGTDEARLASLLTLSDVYGTGWHAAVRGGVSEGSTVTVIGDGAVGLLAVLSARQLGAERIVLMGRHQDRTDLGREYSATDVVAERGADGIAKVRDLTDGGSQVVLEAVGHMPAYEQAIGIIRPGGVISRVGVPQYEDAPVGFGTLFGPNITLTGGPAPVRAYVEQLLPAVLGGSVNPGKVFDCTVSLEETPKGYAAMDERTALKVLVQQPMTSDSTHVPRLTLNNGVDLPALGFGVFQTSPEETVAAVETALASGYRHIDTAAAYGNERQVGEAISRSGLDRSEIFVETKVWITDYGYDETLHAFDKSAGKLGIDQIDLLILHQALPGEFELTIGAFQALETLLADGKVRVIGVSNFMPEHLSALMAATSVVPVVNQIEVHPYFTQAELLAFDAEHGILSQAWSPIGGITFYRDGSKASTLGDPVINQIAAAHGKTAAQVMLRWHLQQGRQAIPKSVTPSRIAENFDVFDFELTADQLTAIDALDTGLRGGPEPEQITRATFGRDIPEA